MSWAIWVFPVSVILYFQVLKPKGVLNISRCRCFPSNEKRTIAYTSTCSAELLFYCGQFAIVCVLFPADCFLELHLHLECVPRPGIYIAFNTDIGFAYPLTSSIPRWLPTGMFGSIRTVFHSAAGMRPAPKTWNDEFV